MACWDVCACADSCDCKNCACPCYCKTITQCSCCAASTEGRTCEHDEDNCECSEEDQDNGDCHHSFDNCHDNDDTCHDPEDDDIESIVEWNESLAQHWYGVSQGKGVIKAQPVDGAEYDPGFEKFARDALRKAGIE